MDFLTLFRSGKHDLSTGKNQQNEFWHFHAEDQAREQFRFVPTHLGLLLLNVVVQRLKLDLKTDIVGSNDVLDEEVGHVDRGVADLSDVLGVPLGCLEAVILALGTCAHHSTRRKDQRSSPRLSDAHDCRRKTLWFILHVFASTRDVSQVKILAVEVRCTDDILEFGHLQEV